MLLADPLVDDRLPIVLSCLLSYRGNKLIVIDTFVSQTMGETDAINLAYYKYGKGCSLTSLYSHPLQHRPSFQMVVILM